MVDFFRNPIRYSEFLADFVRRWKSYWKWQNFHIIHKLYTTLAIISLSFSISCLLFQLTVQLTIVHRVPGTQLIYGRKLANELLDKTNIRSRIHLFIIAHFAGSCTYLLWRTHPSHGKRNTLQNLTALRDECVILVFELDEFLEMLCVSMFRNCFCVVEHHVHVVSLLVFCILEYIEADDSTFIPRLNRQHLHELLKLLLLLTINFDRWKYCD